MKANANSMSFNTNQERARRRRNRNVTMVLFGIVLLFLVCHIGEVAISIYELVDVLDGERSMFPQWASNTIILNHLLIVINSSLNFVIYCKDVVFRYVLKLFVFHFLGAVVTGAAHQSLGKCRSLITNISKANKS